MTYQWLGNWGAKNKKKGEKEKTHVYFLVILASNSRRLQQNRCFTVMQESSSRQSFYENPWITFFTIAITNTEILNR